jgi:hypothetical protein
MGFVGQAICAAIVDIAMPARNSLPCEAASE